MVRNWYWWLVGGGIAAWALTARAQKAIEDRLVVIVTFAKSYALADAGPIVAAIRGANVTCPGLPPLGDILEMKQLPSANGPTLRVVLKATYTHDRRGSIQAQPLSCLMTQIKKVNAAVVDVAAERPAV